MTTKEVMKHYDEIVRFPITRKKIQEAGYDYSVYLTYLITDLADCEDSNRPTIQHIIVTARKILAIPPVNGRGFSIWN